MAKATATKRDNIPATDTKKTQEIDVLSPVDRGFDFVPAGQTVQVGHDNKS